MKFFLYTFLIITFFNNIFAQGSNSDKDFFIALKQKNLDILKNDFISVSNQKSPNYSK